MDDTLLQIGVGGIFAILLIQLVLNWLKPILLDKEDGDETLCEVLLVLNWLKPILLDKEDEADTLCEVLNRIGADVLLLSSQMRDLHAWHNVRTPDGGFVWYVPSSLEKAITSLADSIDRQTELTRLLTEIVRENKKTMQRVERNLTEK
jgi:hypothetical protein